MQRLISVTLKEITVVGFVDLMEVLSVFFFFFFFLESSVKSLPLDPQTKQNLFDLSVATSETTDACVSMG